MNDTQPARIARFNLVYVEDKYDDGNLRDAYLEEHSEGEYAKFSEVEARERTLKAERDFAENQSGAWKDCYEEAARHAGEVEARERAVWDEAIRVADAVLVESSATGHELRIDVRRALEAFRDESQCAAARKLLSDREEKHEQ